MQSTHAFIKLLDYKNKLPSVINTRANNCRVYKIKYRDSTRSKILLLVKCKEDYSKPTGHLVLLRLKPSKIINSKSRVRATLKIPMKVYCTCPAYLYWGSRYNATKGVYQMAGHPKEFRKPDIRDPQRKNLMCKHLSAVANKLSSESIKKSLKGNISKHSINGCEDEFETIEAKDLTKHYYHPKLAHVELNEDNLINVLTNVGILEEEEI